MCADCTFLLSTYDGGDDLWEGFFTALQKQWPEMDMPIVVNTERKSYFFPGYEIKSFAPCANGDLPWAKRLKVVLNQIDTEFILLFLEDYWLDDKVDNEYFERVLQWIRENKDISTFSFYPCEPEDNIHDKRFERMALRPQKCKYKLNCQVALWRRDMLIKYLRDHESPWEWELWGSIRASRYKERFYTLIPGSKLVFSYGDPNVGCLIHRGKWVKGVAERLAKMYNLDVDFSIRGFEDFDALEREYESYRKRTVRDKLFQKNFFNVAGAKIKYTVRKIRSLI